MRLVVRYTHWAAIQFRGVNAKNFGDYTDGFSPQNATSSVGAKIPGCSVADDFSHGLGDAAEGRFATALNYRVSGQAACGAATGLLKPFAAGATAASDVVVQKTPWRENRIMRR